MVVHGDDSTFAGKEVELGKTPAKLYDVQVCEILGSARRVQRETQIRGQTLRWTDDGLEYGADEKHPQAMLRGVGSSEDWLSKHR